MPNSVHLTVATVIYQNGAFLCVEEVDNGRSVINQPAGHVEAEESLIEAACRETLEETGWRRHANPAFHATPLPSDGLKL